MISKLDMIIIGAGPGGLSAALLAKKASKSYLILEKGKKIMQGIIDTYPKGKKVYPSVQLHVSASSRSIYERLSREGIIKILSEAGAIIVPSACGACVNFGPGSVSKGEVGISATNRNFPGRMGQGDVYLANPAVVAASAVAGRIIFPNKL